MKYFAKIFTILTIFILLAGVSSCGKVANPEPVEGSSYPHSYPRH